MPDGLTDLVHDAAVLHAFVDFIEEYCKEHERSQTYVDSSGLFFQYAKDLAAGIKQELSRGVYLATQFPSRLLVLRRNMLTLKYYLQKLHTLIKPAADAHTLTIPAPLIKLASQQLQRIEAMRNSKIVILLTPELMYFQTPHTNVKNQARVVQSFIPRAKFPAKLGFIELPYSQGPSFFTNIAIYHEIGHFVYEELSNQTPPHSEINTLKSATLHSLAKEFLKGPKDRQSFAFGVKIIEYWTQEIFCDLFALRLVGPAFSFALVEIMGMLGFLSRETSVKFNPTHPAPAYRFAEHVKALRQDSWWDAIADIDPAQKKLLEKLAAISSSQYRFYVDDKSPGSQKFVTIFLEVVVPAIRKLVRKITPDADSAVKRFVKTRSDIEDCFRVGVVPLTKTDSPDPVSIINAAFCFYLSSLPQVIKQFDGKEAVNNLEIRSKWTRRLEQWTMKAIEDSQIQTQLREIEL